MLCNRPLSSLSLSRTSSEPTSASGETTSNHPFNDTLMSARRFADVQALVAVGANVSQRFLALELRQLKQYAATSSLLKRSNNWTAESISSSTTIPGTASPQITAAASSPLSSKLSQTGELSGNEPHKAASVTGTWIDNIFTSIPLKATLSPSSSASVSVSSTVPSGAQVTAAEEPSLLDPSFLATPAAHGYKRPTAATVTPQQPTSVNTLPPSSSSPSPSPSTSTPKGTTTAIPSSSASFPDHRPLKKEEPINRDALETLLRESKWLDGLPAEDETHLNKGAADQTSLWAQRERLGPRIFVYESLKDNIEEGSEDEKLHRYQDLESMATKRTETAETVYHASTPVSTTYTASSSIPSATATVLPTVDAVPTLETTKSIPNVEPSVSYNSFTEDDGTVLGESPKQTLTEAAMPTSRVGRLFHYGTLAASLGVGALTETVRRSVGRGTVPSESPMFLTPANMDRLVNKLTKMRGAALKLGQMLSIQGKGLDDIYPSPSQKEKRQKEGTDQSLLKFRWLDNKMLPTELEEVLLRVQNSANFMPEKQMRVGLDGIEEENRIERKEGPRLHMANLWTFSSSSSSPLPAESHESDNGIQLGIRVYRFRYDPHCRRIDRTSAQGYSPRYRDARRRQSPVPRRRRLYRFRSLQSQNPRPHVQYFTPWHVPGQHSQSRPT